MISLFPGLRGQQNADIKSARAEHVRIEERGRGYSCTLKITECRGLPWEARMTPDRWIRKDAPTPKTSVLAERPRFPSQQGVWPGY